jgi:hypothetical protein
LRKINFNVQRDYATLLLSPTLANAESVSPAGCSSFGFTICRASDIQIEPGDGYEE